MYIQTQENVKCSKCGSMNYYDTITRKTFNGVDAILKCRKCNHESVQSTLKFNTESDLLTQYNMQLNKEPKEF